MSRLGDGQKLLRPEPLCGDHAHHRPVRLIAIVGNLNAKRAARFDAAQQPAQQCPDPCRRADRLDFHEFVTLSVLDFGGGGANFEDGGGQCPRPWEVYMVFVRIVTGAGRVVSSRAARAMVSSVAGALVLGASGDALAQCAGSYSSSSGSGVHSTPSPSAGVHSTTSAPSIHSGASSCSTGGTTSSHGINVNMAHLSAGPSFGGARHFAAPQRDNSHVMKSTSKGVKP